MSIERVPPSEQKVQPGWLSDNQRGQEHQQGQEEQEACSREGVQRRAVSSPVVDPRCVESVSDRRYVMPVMDWGLGIAVCEAYLDVDQVEVQSHPEKHKAWLVNSLLGFRWDLLTKPRTTSGWRTCTHDRWEAITTFTAIKRASTRLRALTGVSLALGAALAFASPARASFGIEEFENELVATAPLLPATQGPPATQAGSHPYSMTTTIVVNHHSGEGGVGSEPDGDAQNVEVNLPAGVVVNPTATATRCSEAVLETSGFCPSGSQVGVDTYHLGLAGGINNSTPVFNMETPPNEPAELAFKVIFEGITVHILGRVRTATDYGLSAEAPDINQQVEFLANTITLWGDPSSSEHDAERTGPTEETGKPFLTLPTACGGPLTATMTANSWQEPQSFASGAAATNHDAEGNPVMVSGCEFLHFNPSMVVQPTSRAADSPTGLNVELNVPQEESLSGLAEANLEEAVVTLPAGMAVSPSAADGGLGACTSAQIGLGNASSPTCPPESKVGSMEIETQLLEVPLKGSVYLAQQGNAGPAQGENPFKSLIALYLIAEAKGVVIKVPGEVRLDPVTGQLTTRFGEDPAVEAENQAVKGHLLLPQLPFSRLKLEFFGGPRAALTTPSACGSYTVTSSLTPYSAPESGPPATPSSTFDINEACGGGAFNPTFNAGTTNNQAGAFSPFVLTGFREDTEQNVSRLQVAMPPGLLGSISGVPLCEEPQAAQGACAQASLIGHVTVGVGAGPDPLNVTGEVFLTGPYRGAPFGLSVRVPAVAGPFNLGTVVVRAAINIDPTTAALTVTSEPLPQILQGIPIQVRSLHVGVDREHFTFNPTSCDPLSITASLITSQGATAALSQRFQATNCAALAFKPEFTVSTSGKTSKADGASLDAKVVYPPGSQGAQADIAKVKVDLPKQLPSRLTTLQKACLAAVFEANPANCPAGSVIGIVRATTPVLPVPLAGPVYFVSHGGEAFPSLVIVLQGDGVRVDLTAVTFISKAGITSSTFNGIPDVPVSSFELYLPEGKYSALAANGDLCTSKLAMPTAFVAQNGAEIHESTKITVIGCPKAAKKAKPKKKAATASHEHRKEEKGR